MTQETIIDLQTRLAFQESNLDDLNLTVVRQQNEIDVLKREVLRMKEMVENMREQQQLEGGGVELPPHY